MRFANLAFIALAVTPILALPHPIDKSSISRRNTGDLQSGGTFPDTGTGTQHEPSPEQPTGHEATTVKTKEQKKAEKKARKKARKQALMSQAASTVGLNGRSSQDTGTGTQQEPSPEQPTGQGATTEKKLEKRRKKKKAKKEKEGGREDESGGESFSDLLNIRSPHGNPQSSDEPPAQVSGGTLAQGQERMEQLLKSAKALQAHAQQGQPSHGAHS